MSEDEEPEHEPSPERPADLGQPSKMEQMVQQSNQMHQQISQMRVWSLRQAADIRAKAEMLEEHELDAEVYGESDPEDLFEAAEKIERVASRLGLGEDRYVT